MGKIIRPRYPVEVSVGLLMLIFALSLFLSRAVFKTSAHDLEVSRLYLGMALVSTAITVMLLILWEEFLFPVKIKPEAGEVVFRNHTTKLKTQIFIYFLIPVIVVYIYFNYEVDFLRFSVWAVLCVITPVVGKLISGIKNYNDFLKLTDDAISYKNNQEEGVFDVKTIQQIRLIKDERNVLHKVEVALHGGNLVTIDLDEMELDEYYNTIDQFIVAHYKNLI
jgi:hypothetical protein